MISEKLYELKRKFIQVFEIPPEPRGFLQRPIEKPTIEQPDWMPRYIERDKPVYGDYPEFLDKI